MFGLNNSEGNHGEDVKEYWFYLDSTPTVPQMKVSVQISAAGVSVLGTWWSTNRSRGKQERESTSCWIPGYSTHTVYSTWSRGVRQGGSRMNILMLGHGTYNRGPDAATLHLLPTLWFRNTWSWGEEG